MQSQSKSFQGLVWLNGARTLRTPPPRHTRQRIFLRVYIEPLQSRLLMSITSSGSETLVNTTTTGTMTMPAIAMNPAGNSVVVWTTSSSGGQVLAQRYNINGSRVGSQFQVDQNPAGSSATPSVAIDDVGDFVVVWIDGASVFARVFNSAGTAVTGDTLVTNTAVGTSRPVVAMNAAGAFTVVWEGSGSADSDGIYKRQFLVSGIAVGSAVVVNSTFAGSQINPAIAIDSSGDAIIAWTDNSTSASTIQAAYFSSSGTSIPQFAAGAETGMSEDHASVGIDSAGAFVIAWQTDFGSLFSEGVTARIFSPSGTPTTASPFVVDSYTFGSQSNPSVAERADGSFSISFTSQNEDGSGAGVYAQPYTSAGATDGSQFLVNTTTSSNQQDSAAVWAGGISVIAWDGNGVGDSSGIFLKRYTNTGSANQTPVNTVPSSQNIYENNLLNFTMSVSDADAQGGVEQLSLTATNGTLALATTSNLIFSSGGNNSAAITFSGTLASLNAALSGMTFTPTANFVGAAQVQLVTNDLGNTGVGGPASATSSFTINVHTPPTADTIPGAQTTLENVPLIFAPQNDNSLYAGSAAGAIGLNVSSGTLTLSSTSGLTLLNGTSNGSTEVEVSGTVANINAALNGLTLTPATNFTGSDPLIFITATSAANLTTVYSSYTIPVTVTAPPPPVNQPPVITMPATQTTAENAALTLSNANAIAVTDSDADGNAEQLTLTATNGTLTLASTFGLAFSTGTGTGDSSMTITGTLAHLNNALNGLVFTPASGVYGDGAIYASIDDLGNTGTGGAKTTVATLAINITQVNQPPTIALPPTQATTENSQLDFSSANSNGITLTDVDAAGAAEKLTLTSTDGTLQLGTTTGLTFNSGTSGQSSMTISGTLDDLNSALNTLAFVPTTNFVGNASVQLLINDLGNTGSGGAKTASGLVNITVSAVAHTPSVTNAASNQDQMTTAGLVITENPLDASQSIYYQITGISGGSLFQNDGTTPISNGNFITQAQGAAGLKFRPNAADLSNGSFDVQSALAPASSGLGGNVIAATIQVTPADAPVNTVPSAQSVLENTSLVFSTADNNAITISNADGGIQRLVITTTNGTLSLGASTSNTTLTLYQTPSQLTAQLNGLTFIPSANYTGPADIQLTTTDVFSIAVNTPLSVTSSVPITVTPITVPVTPAPPVAPTPPPSTVQPTPVLVADDGLILQSLTTATIATTALDATQTGFSSSQLTFTLTQLPKFGQLLLDGQTLAAGASFTQADIDQGKLAYASTSTTSADDGFSFVVSDSAGTALPPATFPIHAVAPEPPAPPTVPVKPAPRTDVPALPAPQPVSTDTDNASVSLVSDLQDVQTQAAPIFTATPDSEIAVAPADILSTSGDAPVNTPAFPAPRAQAAPAPAHNAAPRKNAAAESAPPTVDPKPSTPDQSSSVPSSGNTITTLQGNQKLWQDLDVMQHQADAQHEAHVRIVAGSATLVSAGMSMIYFVWAIRAGSILSSLLSSMPAWNLVDPLPILNQASGENELGEPDSDEDEESLESMVDQPRRKAA